MTEPIFSARATGKLPRVNRKFGATVVGGKARLFTTKEHKDLVEAITFQFQAAHSGPPIDHYVDARLILAMSKRTDSDAPVKAILDCLEKAGVVSNDKRIRDIVIRREYQSDEYVEVTLWHTDQEVAAWRT